MYDVKRDVAETIYISHPEASYGVFCFNSQGDLFINSDWGFYGYAWRSYGKDNPFKKFLSQCNAEYIVGKFSINHREVSGKKMPPHREKNLTILVEAFISELKNEQTNILKVNKIVK
jgi:hypothetical protein